jgi:hypothetical protein
MMIIEDQTSPQPFGYFWTLLKHILWSTLDCLLHVFAFQTLPLEEEEEKKKNKNKKNTKQQLPQFYFIFFVYPCKFQIEKYCEQFMTMHPWEFVCNLVHTSL